MLTDFLGMGCCFVYLSYFASLEFLLLQNGASHERKLISPYRLRVVNTILPKLEFQ